MEPLEPFPTVSMALGLIAKKVGMSRIFLENGEAVPVTYLEILENRVIRTKTKEKDGYEAVVLGVGEKTVKTRKGKELKRYKQQKEFQVASLEGVEMGTAVPVSTLPKESLVTVTGVSKGKGFQGVVKRHHFSGGPRTHGSHFKREPGSIGMRTWPGRVHKGKRMAGHMGLDTITIKHRPVIMTDEAKNIVAIKGPIPGPNGCFVTLTPEA